MINVYLGNINLGSKKSNICEMNCCDIVDLFCICNEKNIWGNFIIIRENKDNNYIMEYF